MTFRSEVVRLLYHQLPLTQQISLTNMDEKHAKNGYEVHIEAVSRLDRISEVVVCITMRDKFDATASDDISLA